MYDWKIYVPNNDEPIERVYNHDTAEEALEDYNENYDSDPQKAIKAEQIMIVVSDEWSGEDHKFETTDEACEWISEQEIIYYSHAMNHLIEQDCSLNESIGLAVDMGIELKNINSELLATILYQDMLNNNINEE